MGYIEYLLGVVSLTTLVCHLFFVNESSTIFHGKKACHQCPVDITTLARLVIIECVRVSNRSKKSTIVGLRGLLIFVLLNPILIPETRQKLKVIPEIHQPKSEQEVQSGWLPVFNSNKNEKSTEESYKVNLNISKNGISWKEKVISVIGECSRLVSR